jgi:hypothetical protein
LEPTRLVNHCLRAAFSSKNMAFSTFHLVRSKGALSVDQCSAFICET